MSITGVLEQSLRQVEAGLITEVFVSVILLCFVFSLLCGLARRLPGLLLYTPNLLTSLGILGTFVGIVVGLLKFDPTRIDASIGLLLAGLETAFITSLVGMGCAIIFKLLASTGLFDRREVVAEGEEGVGAEHILQALLQQNQLLQQQTDELKGQLGELHGAIQGAGGMSISSQLNRLHEDLLLGHKDLQQQLQQPAEHLHKLLQVQELQQDQLLNFSEQLWQRLQDFAELMSKSATEQVIEALNRVIIDFNDNLTEQFGENFHQLNVAVGALLQWQEDYRSQLQQMMGLYEQAVGSIEQTESCLQGISQQTALIPKHLSHLANIIGVSEQQLDELHDHLQTFADMRDKAVAAMPQMQQHIDATLAQVSDSVVRASEHHQQLLQVADQHMQHFVSGSVAAQDQIQQALQQGVAQIAEQVSHSAENWQQSVGASNQALQSVTQQLIDNQHNLQGLFDQHLAQLQADLQQGSDAMQQTLNVGIEGMEATHQQMQEAATEAQQLTLKHIEQSATHMQWEMNKVYELLQNSSQETLSTVESVSQKMQVGASEAQEWLLIHIQDAGKTLAEEMAKVHEAMQMSVQQTVAGLEQNSQDLQQSQGEIQQQLHDYLGQSRDLMQAQMREIYQSQEILLQRQFKTLEHQITEAATRTGDAVNGQLELAIRSTEQEIEQAMTAMGSALTQITGRFTQDYQRLVTQMAQVVQQPGRLPDSAEVAHG